jgi:hypothetical protein
MKGMHTCQAVVGYKDYTQLQGLFPNSLWPDYRQAYDLLSACHHLDDGG